MRNNAVELLFELAGKPLLRGVAGGRGMFKFAGVKLYSLILCLFVAGINGYAQEENVWAFGYNAGINFNTNPPTPIWTGMMTVEGCASVCNANGQLLFYTDGTSVRTRNHTLMANGTDIMGAGEFVSMTSSTSQAALIVPMPGDPYKYYVFSLGMNPNPSARKDKDSIYLGRLSYSIVNMNLNSGLGAVTTKGIVLDSQLTEHMAAVSGNICDVWLLVVSKPDTAFKAYNIDVNGIDPHPVISKRIVGEKTYKGVFGCIDVSPDRSKLAIAQGNLILYDFDANLGKITQPLILVGVDSLSTDLDFGYYGVCFSPDNTKLYASDFHQLQQFNVSLNNPSDIIASNTFIGPQYFGAIQRGPDAKLYVANPAVPALNVINQPNLAGTACQFIIKAFPLSPTTISQYGLPNFLHKRIHGTTVELTLCSGSSSGTQVLKAKDTSGQSYIWEDSTAGHTRIVDRPGIYWVRYQVPVTTPCMYESHVDSFKVVFLAINDTTICRGTSIQLNAAGNGNFAWDVLPGGSPLSSLSCTTCNNPIANPALTTTYTVKLQVSPNCTSYDTITIFVKDAPVFDAGPGQMTCVNDSLLLSLNVTSVPGNGVYTARWSPATYLSSDTGRKVYTRPYEDIRYVVTVTPDGVAPCPLKDTIDITVLKGYDIFNGDTAICRGDVIQILATGDPRYSYTWTPDTGVSNVNVLNPLITTDSSRTYIITARYPGCTDSVRRLQIEVQPVPTVVTRDDQAVCAGDTLQLTTIVTPAYDRYSYSWTPGAGLDNPGRQSPVFSGVISGQQKIEVSTPIGCKGSDSLNIFVVNVAFLQISNDTVMCPHDSVQLHITGDSLVSFYWAPNWRISDTVSNNPFVSPEHTQYYTVYGIDSANCKDTAQVLVTVKQAAIITLPDSVTIYPGNSYQLEPQTNCMYFSWFPYIGLTSPDISNPVATPEVNTRYYVAGITEFGCKAIDSIDVLVSDDSQIDMPNAFAPGNGPNSILRVIHLGRATLKSFTVYNRWGVKMFETSNISEGWNGTFNRQPQPQGVYVYVVEAQTYRGRVVRKQGNVTLLR